MATINNVNNGDTGLDARNKINQNDNALNAQLTQAVNSIGTLSNLTPYTDAQARAAQELLQSTGTAILFDRPKSYGYPAALTGTIGFTFDFTNAINGTAQVVRVNSTVEPTFPASAKQLVKGWAASVDVYYYMTAILIDSATPTWEVHVTSSVAL